MRVWLDSPFRALTTLPSQVWGVLRVGSLECSRKQVHSISTQSQQRQDASQSSKGLGTEDTSASHLDSRSAQLLLGDDLSSDHALISITGDT